MRAALYRDIIRIGVETQDNDGDEGADATPAPRARAAMMTGLRGRRKATKADVPVAVAVGGHRQLWQSMRDPNAELWSPQPFRWALEALPRMHN